MRVQALSARRARQCGCAWSGASLPRRRSWAMRSNVAKRQRQGVRGLRLLLTLRRHVDGSLRHARLDELDVGRWARVVERIVVSAEVRRVIRDRDEAHDEAERQCDERVQDRDPPVVQFEADGLGEAPAHLHDEDLHARREDDDHDEHGVGVDALEDVPVVVDAPCVELVEDLAPHERVEDDREVGVVVADHALLAAVLVEHGLALNARTLQAVDDVTAEEALAQNGAVLVVRGAAVQEHNHQERQLERRLHQDVTHHRVVEQRSGAAVRLAVEQVGGR
mmetsp:Transcript_24164/g.83891  ORF Transcript_24164/g.83891 Transcript_24164/m.83891 type:complete len:279 (+) Transcript_24164:30-866(+)